MITFAAVYMCSRKHDCIVTIHLRAAPDQARLDRLSRLIGPIVDVICFQQPTFLESQKYYLNGIPN